MQQIMIAGDIPAPSPPDPFSDIIAEIAQFAGPYLAEQVMEKLRMTYNSAIEDASFQVHSVLPSSPRKRQLLKSIKELYRDR